jgi:AcrR family transcriptional regulator
VDVTVESVADRRRGRPRQFSAQDALAAAVAVFAERGYEHTSLTDLTEAMGINRTSMYLAFGSKEELFLLAMKTFQAVAGAHLTECLARPSARDGVHELLHDHVDHATSADRPAMAFITQPPLTHAGASAAVIEGVRECRSFVQLTLAERFEHAVREGELPPDADTSALARFYSVVIQGIALDAQHGGARDELRRAADTAVAAWPAR